MDRLATRQMEAAVPPSQEVEFTAHPMPRLGAANDLANGVKVI